jgi:UDP-N-acetylglucosamine 4,6-dehydratase
MTRFWIRVEDGAKFVERALRMMGGGEIFIPRLPSMRITDLATAVAADCEQEVVGIPLNSNAMRERRAAW